MNVNIYILSQYSHIVSIQFCSMVHTVSTSCNSPKVKRSETSAVDMSRML